MNDQERLYAMALAQVFRFTPAELLRLYRTVGSASAIMQLTEDNTGHDIQLAPKTKETLRNMEKHIARAAEELEYAREQGIKVLVWSDDDYPKRLCECDDAPLVLYYRGTADLNGRRIISVVGTRHATVYGQDLIRRFMLDLKQSCPDALIVSGLAYGVDICAHRNALEQGMETVGVLAHGSDELYPSAHRDTANRMVSQGGLLTEYMRKTRADKVNFVKRNRIVAGLADACVIIESASKGGGLITAHIARAYNREVFAFPGRTGDQHSQGCNLLIRDQVAALITSADDFITAMGWEDDAALLKAKRTGIERELFPQLSADEQIVVDVLSKTNDLQINVLTVKTNIPVGKLSALLFGLEMKGVVRTMAGGTYHLFHS